MESVAQRFYTKASYYVYKPLFHVLMTIALPGIIAYVWAFLIFLVVSGAIVLVSYRLILPRVLRSRRVFGISNQEIEKSVYALEGKNAGKKWGSYLLVPACFGLCLQVAMPVSLRLCSGESYWQVIVSTWEDRHATVYFNAMQNTAQKGLEKAMWVTTFVSFLL